MEPGLEESDRALAGRKSKIPLPDSLSCVSATSAEVPECACAPAEAHEVREVIEIHALFDSFIRQVEDFCCESPLTWRPRSVGAETRSLALCVETLKESVATSATLLTACGGSLTSGWRPGRVVSGEMTAGGQFLKEIPPLIGPLFASSPSPLGGVHLQVGRVERWIAGAHYSWPSLG